MKKGSLVIVGTGILTPAHLSQESIDRIKSADIVHVLVPDPLGMSTLKKLNSKIKDLAELYYDPNSGRNGKNRLEAYELMVESILNDVRDGLKVCAIFYGHPGVFVYPSHASIEKALQEGFSAKMLPAISAEDCLYADLAIDPGDSGSQAYEASQFCFYQQKINPYALLILWQVGVVGDESLTKLTPSMDGLKMLADKLLTIYPKDHSITLYEATTLPISPPRIDKFPLSHLIDKEVNTITTLVIPALNFAEIDHDFCNKWGIDLNKLQIANTASDC